MNISRLELEQVDYFKNLLGTSTRTGVFKLALALLKTLVQAMNQGLSLAVVDTQGQLHYRITVPGFLGTPELSYRRAEADHLKEVARQ